jgi:hypothetical protein
MICFLFFFLSGIPNCRVALCDDAVLVISPSELDKKYSGKLPSNARQPDCLFELFSLSNLSASIDAKGGAHVNLDFGGSKYRFSPYSPVSTELWMQQFEAASADRRVSHLGTGLRALLFEEDTNIPLVVATICECLRQRGDSFCDIWLNVIDEQRPAQFKGSIAILNAIWSERRSVLECSGRDLLRALHFFLHSLPEPLVTEVMAKEMYAARHDGRRLEALVGKIPLPSQVLIGFMLGFCVDLQACSMEDDPETERIMFCRMFANVLVGQRRASSKTEWLLAKSTEEEVDLLLALLENFPVIWRSALRPEKVVGDLKLRAPSVPEGQVLSMVKISRDSGRRRSMRRSSISADWQDVSLPGLDKSVGSIMEKKAVHSGVFLMDSSREPSGDVADVAWVSMIFGAIQKHYPPMPVGKLISLFVADLNRDAKDVLESHKCQVLQVTPAGLSLPVGVDVVPSPGTSLMLICAGRDPPPMPTSKSSHSPDAALGEVSSVSPPASSFGSGSSPSPTSSAPSPAPPPRVTSTKNMPLLRRPDQVSRRRTNTFNRPRSKSLEIISDGPLISPSSPEEDTRVAPEKSVQFSSPDEEESSHPTSPTAQTSLRSVSPTSPPVAVARARGNTAFSSGNNSENVMTKNRAFSVSPVNATSSGSAEIGSASRLRSMSKAVGKTTSAAELPRRGVTVTMTSTTVTTEVVPPSAPKLSMIQRLMGKKKGPQPPLPSDASQPVIWNYVKLVVVGQENVGKTHLCRQMENMK